ncbi:hypothetical protein Trydic_g9846 [Trypoxylus dichotomus]
MARRTKAALDESCNQRWADFMIQASESSSAFWRAVKVMKKQRPPLLPNCITYRALKNAPRKFVKHMQRHTSPVIFPTPMEASGYWHDLQSRAAPQLAAEVPTHQPSPARE